MLLPSKEFVEKQGIFLTLNFHLTDCHQASVSSIAMHFITIFFAPNVKGFTCKLLEEIYLNKRV